MVSVHSLGVAAEDSLEDVTEEVSDMSLRAAQCLCCWPQLVQVEPALLLKAVSDAPDDGLEVALLRGGGGDVGDGGQIPQ